MFLYVLVSYVAYSKALHWIISVLTKIYLGRMKNVLSRLYQGLGR